MTADLSIFDIKGFSTYTRRFAQVLATLCTKAPSIEMCAAWLTSDDDSLQEFVSCNSKLDWTQAIVTIDAARLVAEHCEEGRPEMLAEGAEYAIDALRSSPIKMKRTRRDGWRAVALPAGVTHSALDSLVSRDFAIVGGDQLLSLSNRLLR